MKKIFTTLSVGLLFAFSASSQPIFFEDFENGMPPSFTLYDVDGKTPHSSMSFFNDPWEILVFTSNREDAFAASNSYYTPAGQSNDWLITSAINLTSNNYLYWNARSSSSSKLETYEVLISTTGNAIPDFTLLTTISGENAAWTSRQLDLSTYANQTVYLAYRNISNDKEIIAIDDIEVRETFTLDAAITEITTNEIYKVGDPVTVSAKIQNIGLNNITSFDLNWSTDGGATVNTDAFTGLNLANNAEMTVNHAQTFTASNAGSNTELLVWVSNVNASTDLNSSNDSLYKDVFVNLGNFVNKRVLLEEFTTAPCQFCPDGTRAVNEAVAAEPSIISVGLHACFGSDAMTIPEATAYCSAFSGGAPTANVDRKLFDGESQVGISRGPSNNWLNKAQIQIAKKSPVSVDIKGSYDLGSRQVSITVTSSFVDYPLPGDYALTLYVLEDSVTGTGSGYDQVNYYNTQFGHLYYNKGNPIVGYHHRDVLRDVYPTNNAWGDNTVFPSNITVNSPYSKSYNFTLSNNWDETQVSLVAFVSSYDMGDVNNREVLNATKVHILEIFGVGMEENNTLSELNIYPNPFKAQTNVNFSLKNAENVSIQLMDVTGKLIQSRDLGKLNAGNHMEIVNADKLESGFYFIRITVGDQITTRKISVIK